MFGLMRIKTHRARLKEQADIDGDTISVLREKLASAEARVNNQSKSLSSTMQDLELSRSENTTLQQRVEELSSDVDEMQRRVDEAVTEAAEKLEAATLQVGNARDAWTNDLRPLVSLIESYRKITAERNSPTVRKNMRYDMFDSLVAVISKYVPVKVKRDLAGKILSVQTLEAKVEAKTDK